MSAQLKLLSRNYCHLCTDMLAQLQALQAELDFHLVVVDVDEDEELLSLYDERVPVLFGGERELCHYHLDTRAVIEFVRNAGFGGAAKPLESRP